MQTHRLVPSILLLPILGLTLCVAEPLSIEEIKSRINSISALSASSSSGHFIVVGTNRLENVALIGWCEEARDRIAAVTGLPVPFKQRTIRFIVREDCTDAPGGAAVRHARQGDALVHRIYLRNYDAAYGRRGRQALCHAILAGYVGPSVEAILALPPWLWKGLEQNVLFGVRAANMEVALARWRDGTLDTVWEIVGTGVEDGRGNTIESDEKLIAYGAFVHWFASFPKRRERFKELFDKVASGHPISVATLTAMVPSVGEGMGIDDAWERWLMRQEHVVYLPGTVSTRVMDQLRADLFLHAGTGGVPLDASLPRSATIADLVSRRQEAWIPEAVQDKRHRLELLAVGRATVFRELVRQFDEFLSGLESDAPDTLLLERVTAAYVSMGILADQVEGSGGLLRDERGSDSIKEE